MHIKAFFEINHEGILGFLLIFDISDHFIGDAIHSIDFHPNGTKVITAGCGNGEFYGSIAVWDISGLYNGNNDIMQLGSTQFNSKLSFYLLI